MVRKSFGAWIVILLAFGVGIYSIVNLLTSDNKTNTQIVLACVGLVLIPAASTAVVRINSKIQPISKTIIITGIWVAWVVLTGLAVLDVASYWDTWRAPSNPYPYCGGLYTQSDIYCGVN